MDAGRVTASSGGENGVVDSVVAALAGSRVTSMATRRAGSLTTSTRRSNCENGMPICCKANCTACVRSSHKRREAWVGSANAVMRSCAPAFGPQLAAHAPRAICSALPRLTDLKAKRSSMRGKGCGA